MSRCFVDTNVIVCAYDCSEPEKRSIASALLDSDEVLVLSTQVLLESYNVFCKRLGMGAVEARAIVEQLALLPVVQADAELVLRATRCAERYQLSIWDALIVEAARSSGCTVLLTEDLQHGQAIDGLVIENPFLSS